MKSNSISNGSAENFRLLFLLSPEGSDQMMEAKQINHAFLHGLDDGDYYFKAGCEVIVI